MLRVLILAACAAAASLGLARAEDDPACARIDEPLAYNACLASHGPRAPGLGGASGGERAVPDGADAAPHADRSPAPARFRRQARVVRHQGRVHVEIPVR